MGNLDFPEDVEGVVASKFKRPLQELDVAVGVGESLSKVRLIN
jgi:hypothetical protein